MSGRPRGSVALAALLATAAAGLQGGQDESMVVAPGARLVPSAGPNLTVEAAWGDDEPAPAAELIAPESGEHLLVLRSRDRAGVLSPERRVRIQVDGAGPRLELRVEPETGADGGWVGPGAVASLVASDAEDRVAESSLDVVPDGGEVSSVSPSGRTRVTLPTDGAVVLAASASDRVGNRSTRRFELRVDGEPPRVEIEIEGASAESRRGWTVHAPDSTLRLIATDDQSGVRAVRWTVDGESVEGRESTGRLDHGSHLVEAEVTDGAGNRATATRRFEVDAVGPEIRWEPAEPGGGRRSGRLAAVATDADAGGAQLEWATDPDGPWQIYEIGEGPTRSPVYFRAQDLLGNASELVVDWKAPEPKTPENGAPRNREQEP